MPRDTLDLPLQRRAAFVRAETFSESDRTIDVVWSTGSPVRRWFGMEVLDMSPDAVRLDSLNSGAPFLADHMPMLDSMLGVVVDGSARIEDGRGLATVRFSDRPEVEPVLRDVRAGIIRNVSIGYIIHRFRIEEREDGPDEYRAIDWEPREISAVAVPADAQAQFRGGSDEPSAIYPCTLVRGAGQPAADAAMSKESDMPNDNHAAGDQTAETRQHEAQGAAPPAAPPAAPAPQAAPAADTREAPRMNLAPPQGPSVDEAREEATRSERERVRTISSLCERHGLQSLASTLIEEGVAVDAAREQILDALAEQDEAVAPVREAMPRNARAEQREGQYREAMGAAIEHAAGSRSDLPDGAREFRGLSLIEMARHEMGRRGMDVRGLGAMAVATLALGGRAAGMHSTSDFPIILENVVGRSLRDGYDSAARTFQPWCRRTSISDFKPVSRIQLSGTPSLGIVPEGAEFQYGSLSEGREVYQLATYGNVVALTRQAIINDDLNAFTRIPASYGASAADLESSIVYGILMSNPTMGDGTALFHSDHGNLGAASLVNEAGLRDAYKAFAQQRGLEGRLIAISPSFLITPPGERSVEARKQITATTPENVEGVNPFAGRLTHIEEPRLLPASGDDPWFLAANPTRIDTIEYAYLSGQEAIFIDTRTGFEVDGIEIKVRHDFAAKAIDWRGLYKNPGAAPV